MTNDNRQFAEVIENARNAEERDNHVSPIERENIVREFVARYGQDSFVVANYPFSGSIDEQFAFIIFEF